MLARVRESIQELALAAIGLVVKQA